MTTEQATKRAHFLGMQVAQTERELCRLTDPPLTFHTAEYWSRIEEINDELELLRDEALIVNVEFLNAWNTAAWESQGRCETCDSRYEWNGDSQFCECDTD